MKNTSSQAEMREATIAQALPPSEQTGGAVDVTNEWPKPPGEAAFAGLAGRVVEVADRHTEADRVAVLASFLVAFSCAIGRAAFALVGPTEHYPRVFATLVGRTSKGRKGESWSPVRKLFSMVDPDWEKEREVSGMSSGEGLIYAVRDAVEKEVQDKETGEYKTVVLDPGVEDKRLMVLEPEFARVLQAMARQGNTLSPIIRDGWDRGTLNVLTKSSPMQTTGAHICIVGHITADELRRSLTDTEAANGFANRFLWFAVARSKELPNPTAFAGPDVERLAAELKETIDFASKVGLMCRTPEADELWEDAYHDLSAERDGLVWVVLGRAEAQVLRLSMLYALLDRSRVVDTSHLLSALELWAYTERSAVFIFGNAIGDPIADRILEGVKLSGTLTRTEVSALFAKNVSAVKIAQAIALLQKRGMVSITKDNTGGRPVEVISYIEP